MSIDLNYNDELNEIDDPANAVHDRQGLGSDTPFGLLEDEVIAVAYPPLADQVFMEAYKAHLGSQIYDLFHAAMFKEGTEYYESDKDKESFIQLLDDLMEQMRGIWRAEEEAKNSAENSRLKEENEKLQGALTLLERQDQDIHENLLSENHALKSRNLFLEREAIFTRVAADLPLSQKEVLRSLSEVLKAEELPSYEAKLKLLKRNHCVKPRNFNPNPYNNTDDNDAFDHPQTLTPEMKAYGDAIKRLTGKTH